MSAWPRVLIFVDGRNRVKCLQTGLKLLADDGVIILHDSERAEYNSGIQLFEKIEENNGTCVMKKRL